MVLLQQMMVLFLIMMVGFLCRRIGLFHAEGSRILSTIVVNVANPACILSSGNGDLCGTSAIGRDCTKSALHTKGKKRGL